MMARTPPNTAFRSLERALMRRRFRAVEVPLRLEFAALLTLIAGFLFWRIRVPLDGFARAAPPAQTAALVLGGLALLALAGGALAGARHATRLVRVPPGPSWLALPIESRALARHLAWDSSVPAALVAVPAAAGLVAAFGLIPAWWLGLLAAAFVWLLIEFTRLGCALAVRFAARRAVSPAGRTPLERVLMSPPRRRPVRDRGAAAWRQLPARVVMMRKDLMLSVRATPAGRRAALPLVLGALSVAVWWLPIEPPLRHFAAFVLALLASTAFAEWLVTLSGTDPFPVLRSLPVGVGVVWSARVGWAAAWTAALVLAHTLAARPLAGGAHSVFLVWLGGAALAITVLGVHYGITLYPRAEHAQRMLLLSLAIAMAASVMIPMLGWVLLLTAVLHSARRVPRWDRLEAS